MNEEKRIKDEKFYLELIDRYKYEDEDFLKRVTVENGYTEMAEKAAQTVLNGNREEYNRLEEERNEIRRKNAELWDSREKNPLYEDIHQMAKDIRFFKTIFVINMIIEILAGVLIGLKVL